MTRSKDVGVESLILGDALDTAEDRGRGDDKLTKCWKERCDGSPGFHAELVGPQDGFPHLLGAGTLVLGSLERSTSSIDPPDQEYQCAD